MAAVSGQVWKSKVTVADVARHVLQSFWVRLNSALPASPASDLGVLASSVIHVSSVQTWNPAFSNLGVV